MREEIQIYTQSRLISADIDPVYPPTLASHAQMTWTRPKSTWKLCQRGKAPVRKYKGRQVLSESLMRDLDASNVL